MRYSFGKPIVIQEFLNVGEISLQGYLGHAGYGLLMVRGEGLVGRKEREHP